LIELDVYGEPAPQGSKRVFRGRLVEAQGDRLKKWRKAIADACAAHQTENIILGPVRLEVDFYLTRPKSVSITKRPLPIVPPDCDKLVRAVGDGIGQSECIWGDDSQIVEIIARKFYADDREPGAVIKITVV
jgi:Holliday junction resolvase RusA-like endonuclease